ncbi:MAG: hypothetical protein U0234_10565 [Sandaracinus sp.]
MGRRDVLRRALVVLAASPVLAACGSGELHCTDGSLTPQQLALRSTLHYVEQAADPGRRCQGCILYTGSPTACGTCSAVPGAIHPGGSCDSFVARG